MAPTASQSLSLELRPPLSSGVVPPEMMVPLPFRRSQNAPQLNPPVPPLAAASLPARLRPPLPLWIRNHRGVGMRKARRRVGAKETIGTE